VVPDAFDANLALGDTLAATGNPAAARAAYAIAMRRIADMEPTAETEWQPKVPRKLAMVEAKGPA
jgi:hypothetical protein